MLPASAEAEQGLICSFLLAPKEIGAACIERRISHDMFHAPALAEIFRQLLEMWLENMPVDVVTLTKRLYDKGIIESVGGPAFISQLFTYLPTAINAGSYIDIVEEKHTMREVIRVSTEFASRAYEHGEEPTEFLDEFEQKAMGVRRMKQVERPTMKELTMSVIQTLQDVYENKGMVSGLTTGFDELDGMTDGLHPEQMIVIAARPSHGKTALAMNMVEHIAITLGKPVAVFSLEMSAKQLVQRMLLSRARVNYFAFRDGHVPDRTFPAITAAASAIAEARIFIEDVAGMSIQEARARGRRLRAEQGVEAIFMDYLQLFRSTTRRAQENRSQEVSEVSLGCKQMARELGIPIVVLAQIARDVDKQQRKPRLSDLRESGSIEQDADRVDFITRPEVYAENEEELKAVEGLATITIGKQRNGPIGDVDLTFIKEYARFENRAHSSEYEERQASLLDVPQNQKPKRDPRYND